MSFLKPPKPPTPPAPATPPSTPLIAKDSGGPQDTSYGLGSLISTSPSGLKRKASTQRVSLIGG